MAYKKVSATLFRQALLKNKIKKLFKLCMFVETDFPPSRDSYLNFVKKTKKYRIPDKKSHVVVQWQ
ncbi:MAG: hypothetical protein P8X74_18180 [Reinekea sp.]|jgi:hypothetical protein